MSQLVDFLMGKEAEVSGTHPMPNSPSPRPGKRCSPTQTIGKQAESLEVTEGQAGEQYESAPQAPPPKPLRVDVSGKAAPKVQEEKTAQNYALPSCRRYPLDSYTQVKQASAYFDHNHLLMAPVHRREYGQNLVKRAGALGIKVSAMAERYGADSWASEGDLHVAKSCRRSGLSKEAHVAVLDDLFEKRAMMRPEDFAVALSEFDQVTGLDQHYDSGVLDPYFSTFGKVAETKSIIIGNEYLSYEDLKHFAQASADQLEAPYGEDFVKEFRKDPVGIFSSLPMAQKKVVARLVNSFISDPTPT